MKSWYPPRSQPCAICHTATEYAVVGNRLLSRWDVHRLPAAGVPSLSWRCELHRRYKMRPASAVCTNEYGDLCFTLICGHTSQWVFRGQWAYTPALVEQGLATGQIRLDQRHRCFICGDQQGADE